MDAQLFSLESYINPDVYKALRLHQRHNEIVDSASGLRSLASLEDVENDELDLADQQELGVALLQPVTSSIEYGRTSRTRYPSKRFVCINIEPISTMVSFEDLQLIESVLNLSLIHI